MPSASPSKSIDVGSATVAPVLSVQIPAVSPPINNAVKSTTEPAAATLHVFVINALNSVLGGAEIDTVTTDSAGGQLPPPNE